MKKIIFTVILLISSFSPIAYAGEVSFTQEDRDMLIRLYEGQKAINKRIDDVNRRNDDGQMSINKRIDDLRSLIYVVLAGIFALIGFVLWDRRTTLEPAV